MSSLLATRELPRGFAYPEEFRRIVDQGIVDLTPWFILLGDPLRARREGLRRRYPSRDLIPFAIRGGNDDVACWERGGGDVVHLVHDFEVEGVERGESWPTFWDWFRSAIEDMIAWD